MDDQQKRVRVHEQQQRDGADGNGGDIRGGRGGHGEPEPVPREEGRNAVDAEHERGGQGVRTGLCIGVRERDHGERERRGRAELPLRVRTGEGKRDDRWHSRRSGEHHAGGAGEAVLPPRPPGFGRLHERQRSGQSGELHIVRRVGEAAEKGDLEVRGARARFGDGVHGPPVRCGSGRILRQGAHV